MTETFKPVTPKDAAAMILLRDPEDPQLFWVRRSAQLSFMGGWQAFPGGQCDAADYSIGVHNCDDAKAAAMRVCAIRELFEETGVLVARGIERLESERIASLRQELIDDQVGFAELLEREGLSIDAAMLTEAPRWVTPATSPRRYNTFFFAAWMPDCLDGPQRARVIPGELESGEWLRPGEALEKWRRGEILAAPPVMRPIEELVRDADGFTGRLEMALRVERDVHFRLEFRRGFVMCSLRAPTLPPATHTNCYIIGGEELVVIDPGSPYEEEQDKLDDVVSGYLTSGSRVREIIITHLHPDHIGGVNHLAEKFHLPVAAHRLTAEAIANVVRVDRMIEDNEVIELGGGERDPDLNWRLRALWTPGHARGHLTFYEERTGSLISGDCLVGSGTVVIAPPEGNMIDYLASLERLLELPRLTALFPAHGPVLADAKSQILQYIKHRQEREALIIDALAEKALSIPEIVKTVYTDVPQSRHNLAEMSVLAHLEKLEAQGRVSRSVVGGRWSVVGGQ